MSSSRTFYPDQGDSGRGPVPTGPVHHDPAAPVVPPPRREPEPRIHPARSTALASVPPVVNAPAIPWLRAWGASLALAGAGATLYLLLYLLVGQEILAAALVIGVLTGSGARVGGAPERWSVAFGSAAIGCVAWCAASCAGAALIAALDPAFSLGEALTAAFSSPAAMLLHHADEPVIAVVAVGLVVTGSIAGTALFRPRRPRRR